jgi:gliding motility-associated-like protein
MVNDTLRGVSTDLSHDFAFYGVNTVELIVVSDHGCVDSSSMEYEVAPVLMMPNIFTPNGAGGNNTLTIKNLEYYAPVTLNIQNRWGNPILSTSNYDNKWDGTKNGNDVAEGVYYYELVIKTGKVYTGYIHITR